MEQLYAIIRTIHNAVGGITLLLTLIAAVWLLFTAQAHSAGATLLLRGTHISASVQAALGILLVVLALIVFGGSYVGLYWFHYLLGLAAVGVVSAVTGRARRAPDTDARRYGGMLLGVFLLVLVTFLAGQLRNQLVQYLG